MCQMYLPFNYIRVWYNIIFILLCHVIKTYIPPPNGDDPVVLVSSNAFAIWIFLILASFSMLFRLSYSFGDLRTEELYQVSCSVIYQFACELDSTNKCSTKNCLTKMCIKWLDLKNYATYHHTSKSCKQSSLSRTISQEIKSQNR